MFATLQGCLDIFIFGITSVPVLAMKTALNVFLWILIIIETAVLHISATLGWILRQILLNHAAFKSQFTQDEVVTFKYLLLPPFLYPSLVVCKHMQRLDMKYVSVI